MNNEDIINQIVTERNINETTVRTLRSVLTEYSKLHQMSLTELLDESDDEEEQGIRMKRRTIKQRLLDYRQSLVEKDLSYKTIKLYIGRVRMFYSHYEIELPRLPPLNRKNTKEYEPIFFNDLPTLELIREICDISPLKMKAIILFMTSSGCARQETTNLTVEDFLKACNITMTGDIYHDINQITEETIPAFKIKRQKVNEYYYTFCSNEAVYYIKLHLKYREHLKYDSPLFDIGKQGLSLAFQNINNELGLGKVGANNRFRSHMLRKYHASHMVMGEYGLNREEVDFLQGRSQNNVRKSYFLEDPSTLKLKYIRAMSNVCIYQESQLSAELISARKELDTLRALCKELELVEYP